MANKRLAFTPTGETPTEKRFVAEGRRSVGGRQSALIQTSIQVKFVQRLLYELRNINK